ncbi:MAG: isocitrate lyase/PEP mutase family protein [Rhodospirillales bacterium]|nr:isocitrate lyase/PEP mutase family protein [Rhodospirillales bacterium]
MKPSTALRAFIARGDTLVAPGAYDGLSARLVEQAGFKAVYASGGAISRAAGMPDLGLLGMSEVVERLETMVEAVAIPVIADADTGYGNALNVQRTVRAFERAGVAGFHIEDQSFPKRCGHYDDKALVPAAEMALKIRAARDAAHDPDLVIIARTDALAVEGFEAAIARAEAYREAGADVLFVEAPESEEQIVEIARRLPTPKLINMFEGGKTPLVSEARLRELGYAIVIIPSDLQRAAIRAMRETLAMIRRDGHSGALRERMVSFKDREGVVGTADYLARDRKYAV